MNSAFQRAAAHFIKRPQLTRKQIVTRLYRQGLKTIFSWSGSRDIFLQKARELRAEFEKHKHDAPDSPCVVPLAWSSSVYVC